MIRQWSWLVLYFFILIPPFLIEPVTSGLDPSWRISVNMAAAKGFVFGKDYIFTFGPLGFLSTKNAVLVNKWIILLYELFLIFSTLGAIHYFLKPLKYSFRYSFPTLLVVFLISAYNCELLLLFVYIFSSLLFLRSGHWLVLIPAVLLSAIGFYIKVNYGIILSVLLYTTLLVSVLRKNSSVKTGLGMAFVHIITLYVPSVIGNVDIVRYVQSSLQVINAYNDAMFLPAKLSGLLPVTALILVALFAGGFLFNIRSYVRDFSSLYIYGFCALFFYVMFKNGFVRASPGHINVFFVNSMILFACLYILSKENTQKTWGVIFTAAITISYSILIINPYKDHETGLTKTSVLSRLTIGEYLKDIATDVSYKQILADSARSPQKIAQSYAQVIGWKTVDIIPSEISEIYYYKLNYLPRPVPQSYCAFNKYLDSKNAEKLMSASGPEFLLYHNESLDNRHPFWDESITKRAVVTHYELYNRDTTTLAKMAFDENFYLSNYPDIREAVNKGVFKSGYDHYQRFGREESREIISSENFQYLLFRKRKTPLQMKQEEESEQVIRIGEEFSIRKTVYPQYLYADIRYSVMGKIQRLLFQPPEMKITVTYEDGTRQTYRVIIPIMNTGVLINKRTDTPYDASLFFFYEGRRNANATSIKFEASDGGFEDEIKTKFTTVRFE